MGLYFMSFYFLFFLFFFRFLRILELIVQEPGSAFKAFLPNVISICMDQIYPIIAQVDYTIVKIELYDCRANLFIFVVLIHV